MMNAKSVAILAAVFVLAGCAGFGAHFQPGVSSQNEVQQAMGKPGVTLEGQNGITIWQYPTGPLGLQTHIARFDSKGILLSFKQVLDDVTFAKIEIGKTTNNEVNVLIGPPRRTIYFARQQQTAWDYLYRDVWGYRVEQSIVFDTAGVVVSKPQQRLDDNGRGGSM
jgi:ABC-type glycerol-3-phosphate transport system substrate-binding protein